MRAAQLRDRSAPGFDLPDDAHDVINRRGHRGEQERSRAAAGVIIADRTKRFRRSFHRVAADRAMHVQIDETGSKKISRQVNYFLAA